MIHNAEEWWKSRVAVQGYFNTFTCFGVPVIIGCIFIYTDRQLRNIVSAIKNVSRVYKEYKVIMDTL